MENPQLHSGHDCSNTLGTWRHIVQKGIAQKLRFKMGLPADVVCITCLLISQSIEMLLNLEVDGAWRRIRKEML